MKYIPIVLLFSLSSLAAEPNPKEMTCMEIIDSIKKLEKYKEESERGNYEGFERIAAVVLVHSLYLGSFRDHPQDVDIKKEILGLRAKLSDCKPF